MAVGYSRIALGVVAAGIVLQGSAQRPRPTPSPPGGGGEACDACGASATYEESLSTEGSYQKRTITASGCPNHYSYCTGKGDDGVPGCGVSGAEGTRTEARVQSHSVEIPAEPVIATGTTDVECEAGQIAIALNGVSIYSGWVAPPCTLLDVDDDTAEWTSFDYCSGHSQREGDYHYHFPPTCLLDQAPAFGDGHSPQIGWAKDGFPIYGPQGEGGTAPSSLDVCGGKAAELPAVDNFKYRYYMSGATSDLFSLPSDPKPAAGDYPFAIKCYVGCTWDELSSGDAKCTGGRSGVTNDYIAAALDGYTTQYASSADGAGDLQCGNQATQAAAGDVSEAGATVPWAWIIAASVVSALGALALAAYWVSSPAPEEEAELADQRVDPAMPEVQAESVEAVADTAV